MDEPYNQLEANLKTVQSLLLRHVDSHTTKPAKELQEAMQLLQNITVEFKLLKEERFKMQTIFANGLLESHQT